VAWGVAVAGWQWYQSKVQVSAVRMVLDTRVAVATVKVLRQTHPQWHWQWHYPNTGTPSHP
jgi:hypothetical protein